MPKIFLDPRSDSPVSSASYDTDTGALQLEFDEDGILSSEYFSGRHIDALTIGDDVYEIEIHSDSGPRDGRGRYIYDESTIETEFTLDIGRGRDVGEGLEFGLTDRADGTKQLYEFKLAPPPAPVEPPKPEPVVAPEPVEPAAPPEPVEVPEPIEVARDEDFRVYFYDTATDERVSEVLDGDVIRFDVVQGRDMTLVVVPEEDEGIESMKLDLDGVHTQVESQALYVLHGNRGEELNKGARLGEGTYDLSAEAYSENRGKGEQVASFDMSFRIADDSVG